MNGRPKRRQLFAGGAKAVLANLICSGRITRDEALKAIKKDPYEPRQLMEDKGFFLKKLGIQKEEFEEYIKNQATSHHDFPSYAKWYNRLCRLKWIFGFR